MTTDTIVPTQLPDPIDPPLNCIVQVAFGADPTGNPLEWTWVDITEDVRKIQGVGSRRGRSDESGSVTPASANLAVLNGDGRYTPDNPASPYYGQIRVGTPIRIMPLPGAEGELITLHDTFSRTLYGEWGLPEVGLKWAADPLRGTEVFVDGSRGVIAPGNGGGALVRNTAQWFDGDVRMKVGLTDVVGGDTTAMFAGFTYRWIGYYLATLLFHDDGTVDLQFYDNLGNELVAFINAKHTYIEGDEFWLAVRADGDRHRVKSWKVGDPEPAGWDFDITDSGTPTDPTLTIGPFGEPFGLGGGFGGGFVEGWVSAFASRSGDADNTVVTFDDVTVVARNTPLFFGHVAQWEPDWPEGDISTEYDEGYSRVAIVAGGPLRRILQDNSTALESPMSRAVQLFRSEFSSTPVRAYWPMEESGRDVTSFASPLTGVQPMTATQPFSTGSGDMSTIPGSEPLPQFFPGSGYDGQVPAGAYPHGWVINHLFYMDDVVEGTGGTATVTRVQVDESDVHVWRIRLADAGGIFLEARDSNWDLIASHSTSLDNDAFYGRWMLVSLRVSLDGADLAGQFTIYAAETLGQTSTPETVAVLEQDFVPSASSAGRPGAVKVANLGGTTGSRSWGHIIVASIEQDFSPDGLILFDPEALSGHNGEHAVERVRRIAAEEQVPITFVLTESGAQSERMGPQRSGQTLIAILNEAERVTGAILYESRHQSGLVWRERSSLYRQNPKLILDAESGQIINPLRPILDDLRTVNDTTVSRFDGSSVRVVDEAHVRTHSRYKRDLQVNVFADQQLPDIASWRIHIGTQGGMRYPNVTPYLSGYVQLQPEWLLLEIGDLVRIINLPPQHPPDEVDLLLQGTVDTLRPETWSAKMNAIPAGGWTDLVGFPNDMPGAGACITGRVGDYVSTPNVPELQITGDIDLGFDATCSTWDVLDYIGALDIRRIGPAMWDDTTVPEGNSYALDVIGGFPRLAWSEDGSSFIGVTSRVAVPATGGERAAIRSTLDVDDGAGNHVVSFFYAPSMHAVQGMLIRDNGHARTPDNPSLQITEDIDIRVEFISHIRSPNTNLDDLIYKDDPDPQRGWRVGLTGDGLIRFIWSSDGTNGTLLGVSSQERIPGAYGTGALPQVGGRMAVRVALVADHNDNGVDFALAFYFAHSIEGPWYQIRQKRLFLDPFQSGPTSIFNTDAPIRVGRQDPGQAPFTITRAEVYNGVAYPYPTPGTADPILPTDAQVASPDFRNVVQGASGFTDAQGNSWTLSGDAEISRWAPIDIQTRAGVTNIAATDAVLEFGTVDNGTRANRSEDAFPPELPTPMTVHSGYVKDGIDGTTVADPNFEDLPAGTRVFTDDAGRQWTLHGSETSICPGASTEELARSRLSPTDAYLAFDINADQQVLDVVLDIRNPLNPEPGFESSSVSILRDTDPEADASTSYIVTGGAGHRVISRAFRGSASGLFTFDGGTPGSVATQSLFGGGTNGTWRRASVWAWAPSELSLIIAVTYSDTIGQGEPLTSKQAYYSSSRVIPAGVWTRVTVAGACSDGTDEGGSQDPAQVNTAGAVISVDGVPEAGQQLYLDEFKLGMDAAPFVASHEAPHQFPFDIEVAGEVIRVTGADPVNRHNVQRLHVQRGRGGTSGQAHAAGNSVALHPTLALAL